jgi:hypothetical protein
LILTIGVFPMRSVIFSTLAMVIPPVDLKPSKFIGKVYYV